MNNGMKMLPCVCGSDHIEEVYPQDTNEYAWRCVSCGCEGMRSMVQNEALLLWQEDEDRMMLRIETLKGELFSIHNRPEFRDRISGILSELEALGNYEW